MLDRSNAEDFRDAGDDGEVEMEERTGANLGEAGRGGGAEGEGELPVACEV